VKVRASGSSDSGADGDGEHSRPPGPPPAGYTVAFSSSYPAAAQPSPWLVIGSSPRFEAGCERRAEMADRHCSSTRSGSAGGQQGPVAPAGGSRLAVASAAADKAAEKAADDSEYLSCISN